MDLYQSSDNVFEVPSFLDSILRDDGTHLNNILFGSDKHTSHNPIFGIVLHTDTDDSWGTNTRKYQATICYDVRFLSILEGSSEYEQLLSIFHNIMQCRVNVLTFSSFERALALYTNLLDLCNQKTTYCGMFRRDNNNMVDMHLRLVLQRFLQKGGVEDAIWRCESKGPFFEFFQDQSRLYWYHDYVMAVVDAAGRDGYSVSNVDAAAFDVKKGMATNQTHEHQATTRAKQSLLDLLKKAYKYRFK
jgi:hypothetical protein